MNQIKFLIVLSVFIAVNACRAEDSSVINVNNSVSNSLAPSPSGRANVSPELVQNNTPNAEPTIKRIVFTKGTNAYLTSVKLAAGKSQKFVVAARKNQTMDVEVSSKETSVKPIRGKAQTTEDFGYLNADFEDDGDFIFEVKNPTGREVKAEVRITITGINAEKHSAKDSAAGEANHQ